MKKKRIIRIIAAILFVLNIFGLSMFLGKQLMPVRKRYGATWNQFLCEDENSIDILFVGSSKLYCGVIPAEIYKRTGYTAYVLAASEITASIDYYYVKEALKTQNPGVLMLEMSCVFNPPYESSSIQDIGYMPVSVNRFAATFVSAKPEDWTGLLVPLYTYHANWETELPRALQKRPDSIVDPAAGYTHTTKNTPFESRELRTITVDERMRTDNCSYIRKIKELCDANGIQLLLYLSPSQSYFSQEYLDLVAPELEGIPIVNFNNSEYYDRMDLDLSSDFFDLLHLNYGGAKKFSAFLADFLSSRYTPEHHPYSAEVWETRLNYLKDLDKKASKAK